MSPAQRRAAFRHVALSSVIAVLAFGAAFISGYLFGRADDGPNKSPIAALVAPLDRLAPSPIRANSADDVLSDDEQQRMGVFWETWGTLEREFYNRDGIDRQKMIYGATKGMVDAVGDPHTVYQTPSSREISDADLRGHFDGIGIHVDMRDGKLTVVAPIEGSPADAAGLRPGDVVTHADGQPLAGKTLNDTVLLIRGPRGTVVSLTVSRVAVPEPLTFAVTRAEIRIESVKTRMLDEGVGYVRISSFGSNTGGEAARLVKELLEREPRGLVIDLRSNPGGYLHAAVEVANQFIDGGVVLYQASGNGDRQTYRSERGGVATDARLVVLVNKGTASASEILAAALRDNGRAVLMGEQTFGKGTVQNVHQLSDGSGLRVTTAQWLTPMERPIQGVGIAPDIVVVSPIDPTSTTDPVLEAAVKHLLGGS